MAKSNLKTINNNFITQNSHSILFSKNNLAYVNYLYLSFLFFFNNFIFYKFFFEKNTNMFNKLNKCRVVFEYRDYLYTIAILNNMSYNLLFKVYLMNGKYLYVYDMFYLINIKKIKNNYRGDKIIKSFLTI